MSTSNIIKEIVEEAFDLKYVAYIDPTEGVQVMQEILEFNYE